MTSLQTIASIERPRVVVAEVFEPLWAPRRYKGARGGRGSGKSHAIAERLVIEARSQHIRAACLREVQLSIKDSAKQLIEDKIYALGLERQFYVTDDEIRGPHDSLFIFRGLQTYTANRIKSLEGFNRAWLEEAQTASKASLEIMTPTFRAPGSEMLFTWNPVSAEDPVEVLFNENAGDPDFVCVTANYYDNPWFPADLRKDMERDQRRDPDKYDHVWLGGYRRLSEARVFKNWRIADFETPEDARFRFGADWGFSVDPSVLVRCWAVGRTLYIDAEAYKVGCEIDELPALFAGACPADHPSHQGWSNPKGHRGIEKVLDWTVTADSARPETISYMRRHGFRMVPAIKGKRSLEEGVEFLQAFDIVVHPRCRRTIDELTAYSWETDKLTGQVIPVLADKDNHVIDALRYALEALRRAPQPRPDQPERPPPRHEYPARRTSREAPEWLTA